MRWTAARNHRYLLVAIGLLALLAGLLVVLMSSSLLTLGDPPTGLGSALSTPTMSARGQP